MSDENRPSNIILRVCAAFILLGTHFGVLKLWEARNKSSLTTYTCSPEDHCVPVQNSLWDFYRDASFWDWMWMHAFVVLILTLLVALILAVGGLLYFIITGKSPLGSAEEEDYIPCKDPACACTSHQNEKFETEWQPQDR